MTTETTQDDQMDRLSLLPPELLSTIFDIAHDPEQPLVNGLSRTLYPHVRRSLFRRIRIRKRSSFRLFIATLRGDPSLALFVVDFDVVEACNHVQGLELLEEMLSLRAPEPTASDLNNTFPVRLRFLTSLSFEIFMLTIDKFSLLSPLNSLHQLKIRFNALIENPYRAPFLTPTLPSIKEMILVGFDGYHNPGHRWNRGLARVVDQCPSLARLVLEDQVIPDYSGFLSNLTLVKSTIKSLSLLSGTMDDFHYVASDHLLPDFTNLEHLDLANETVTPALPTYLRRLPRLVSIRLGPGLYCTGPSAEDITNLVRGPARILTLKNVDLDLFSDKQIGHCVDVGDTMLDRGHDEDGLTRDDWEIFNDGGWSREEVKELIAGAEDNGVIVRGTLIDALSTWDASRLELANRIILSAYETKSLQGYVDAKGDEFYERLPDLDVNNLNTETLKLVKIELPEEGWFQFTLE